MGKIFVTCFEKRHTMRKTIVSTLFLTAFVLSEAAVTRFRHKNDARHGVLAPEQSETLSGIDSKLNDAKRKLARDEEQMVEKFVAQEEKIEQEEMHELAQKEAMQGPVGHSFPAGNDPSGPPASEDLQAMEDEKESATKLASLEETSKEEEKKMLKKLEDESTDVSDLQKKEAEVYLKNAGVPQSAIQDMEK